MGTRVRRFWCTAAALLAVALLAGSAAAQVTAEVKAAKGIENKDPVEEGTSFTAGETVHVWSKVSGAANTTVKHVWKRDDKELFTASFNVKGNNWRMNSRRRSVKPGAYVVEVVGGDGTKLGEVSFTVN
jgi:hypothetical protein